MPHVQFDDEQCRVFVIDSQSQYESPNTTNIDFIRWKFMGFKSHYSHHLFIRNSEGKSNSGRAALNPRTLNLRGNYRQMTQVTDLLAIKSNASLMTFIEIIKQYRSLNNDGVLHTSNENSEKIYSNFFKFKEVFKLSAFAFPIRLQKLIPFFRRHILLGKVIGIYSWVLYYLMRCISGINPILLCDCVTSDNLSTILKSFSERQVSLLRSEEFLTWRYSDAPYAYKTYTILLNKQPKGIIVVRLTQFQGVNFFLLMDFITSAPLGRWEGLGMRFAIICKAIAQNADAVFGLFNRKNSELATFFRPPFVAIDDTILPHRTPIFASSLAPSLNTEEFEGMYFSLGDLDYF